MHTNHIDRADLKHGRVAIYITAQAKNIGISKRRWVDDFLNDAMNNGGLSEQRALESIFDAAEADHEGMHHGRCEKREKSSC